MGGFYFSSDCSVWDRSVVSPGSDVNTSRPTKLNLSFPMSETALYVWLVEEGLILLSGTGGVWESPLEGSSSRTLWPSTPVPAQG